MLLQQLNRTDAEKVFIIVQNSSGVTFSGNQLACFDHKQAVASLGLAVATPSTSTLAGFAGVWDSDTANLAYNLVQVYGYRASVAAFVGAASISAAGLIMGPLNANLSAQSTGRSFGLGPIVVLENDLSGEVYAKALIRAL